MWKGVKSVKTITNYLLFGVTVVNVYAVIFTFATVYIFTFAISHFAESSQKTRNIF